MLFERSVAMLGANRPAVGRSQPVPVRSVSGSGRLSASHDSVDDICDAVRDFGVGGRLSQDWNLRPGSQYGCVGVPSVEEEGYSVMQQRLADGGAVPIPDVDVQHRC